MSVIYYTVIITQLGMKEGHFKLPSSASINDVISHLQNEGQLTVQGQVCIFIKSAEDWVTDGETKLAKLAQQVPEISLILLSNENAVQYAEGKLNLNEPTTQHALKQFSVQVLWMDLNNQYDQFLFSSGITLNEIKNELAMKRGLNQTSTAKEVQIFSSPGQQFPTHLYTKFIDEIHQDVAKIYATIVYIGG